MSAIAMKKLLESCRTGGPSCYTSLTELAAAGGEHASVAPAKFAGKSKGENLYAYEQRFVDGELRQVVLIDSKQSQLNRMEAAVLQAIKDGVEPLSKLPRIELHYGRNGEAKVFSDLQLPHRAFDGHIRAGTIDGEPATENVAYKAARNASPANARPLMDLSMVTPVFGGWDASRATNQGRWRSLLVGEIIGVCANAETAKKGGARVDPVGMSVELSDEVFKELLDAQRSELSPKKYEALRKDGKKTHSASPLGVGGIPPSLGDLAGVACERIIRTHVLSFSALRQIRFGSGVAEADVACRALMAAFALNALARSDSELCLRANCDLKEKGETLVTLDRPQGKQDILEPLSIEDADALLSEALHHAQKVANVEWTGRPLVVDGNPAIVAGASATEDDDSGAGQ